MGLEEVAHPDRRPLHKYRHRGAPVVLAGRECTEEECWRVFDRSPHQ